jgi:Glycerophosphoryl diester phosphodiesterase
VIHVWTINDPADAIGLWNIGVQGIVSDDPATILAARPWRRSAERPA